MVNAAKTLNRLVNRLACAECLGGLDPDRETAEKELRYEYITLNPTSTATGCMAGYICIRGGSFLHCEAEVSAA